MVIGNANCKMVVDFGCCKVHLAKIGSAQDSSRRGVTRKEVNSASINDIAGSRLVSDHVGELLGHHTDHPVRNY